MAIANKARMQQLRGPYNSFDKAKMLPGEIAVTTDGSRKVYIAFEAGDAKELAGAEEMDKIAEEVASLEKSIDSAETQLQSAEERIEAVKSKVSEQEQEIIDIDERTRHIVLQVNAEDYGLDIVYTQE